ncbi:MAG: hypothetical protein OXC98_10175 [bacterium]|nr:hypothetical protein [Acidimicrobiia bacterium]MCY4650715.1 hypothetical protein [bacterium]
MELASQLSFISVGIGVIMVIYGIVKFFRQRADLKKRQDPGRSEDDG